MSTYLQSERTKHILQEIPAININANTPLPLLLRKSENTFGIFYAKDTAINYNLVLSYTPIFYCGDFHIAIKIAENYIDQKPLSSERLILTTYRNYLRESLVEYVKYSPYKKHLMDNAKWFELKLDDAVRSVDDTRNWIRRSIESLFIEKNPDCEKLHIEANAAVFIVEPKGKLIRYPDLKEYDFHKIVEEERWNKEIDEFEQHYLGA